MELDIIYLRWGLGIAAAILLAFLGTIATILTMGLKSMVGKIADEKDGLIQNRIEGNINDGEERLHARMTGRFAIIEGRMEERLQEERETRDRLARLEERDKHHYQWQEEISREVQELDRKIDARFDMVLTKIGELSSEMARWARGDKR